VPSALVTHSLKEKLGNQDFDAAQQMLANGSGVSAADLTFFNARMRAGDMRSCALLLLLDPSFLPAQEFKMCLVRKRKSTTQT
jgi:hypothetical protein